MKIFMLVALTCPLLLAAGLVRQDLDYADAMQTIDNPDRGFYTPQVLHLKPEGTVPIQKPYGKFLHLRAELSEFSSRAPVKRTETDTTWGKSMPLTEDALNALRKSFQGIRNFGGTVIVRFCYDPWYTGISNTGPEQSIVLEHVKQLAAVLSENTDVITAVEMGMYGAYGEMHSDTTITYERVSEAINLMLRNTPPELKILTRTAKYAAAVLGVSDWGKNFNLESDVFKAVAAQKGDTIYRVGMFNDGYLGTQYDYGSWDVSCETGICREEGVAWLEKYGVNTSYGGEALTTASGYKVINTPEFLAYEGFRTHTSYLNIQWNDKLIDSWKKVQFQKKDFEYDSSVTGFKYIEDHLGYRFVLRNSQMVDSVGVDGNFRAVLTLQNVGFGNVTRRMSASVVLRHRETGNHYEFPLPEMDFQKIHSRSVSVKGEDTLTTFDGTDTLHLQTTLPSSLPLGDYTAFLKISSENRLHHIRFANESSQYDSTLHGNKMGSFVLTEKLLSVSPRPRKKGKIQSLQRFLYNGLGQRFPSNRANEGAKKKLF